MGIRNLSTASISTGAKRSKFWDQSSTIIIPAFESIATANATGSSSSIGFTNIPQTYKHLQIRGLFKASQTTYALDNLLIRFNATGGTSYARHLIKGDRSSALAYHNASVDYTYGGHNAASGSTGSATNIFTPFIIDIFDYTNTSKYKSIKTLIGVDHNGTGVAQLSSGLFQSQSAITEIQLYEELFSNVASGSTLALYGIKGA